jgi:hypothetical protein
MIILLLLAASLLMPNLKMASAQTTGQSASPKQVQDVFVFSNPDDQGRLIVLATLAELTPDTIYQLNFDTNRDGNEDRVMQVTLSGTDQLQATVTVPSLPERTGAVVQRVRADSVSGPVSTHASPQVLSERGKPIRAFVGVRSNGQAIVVDLPLSLVLAEHKSDFDFWMSVYQKEVQP